MKTLNICQGYGATKVAYDSVALARRRYQARIDGSQRNVATPLCEWHGIERAIIAFGCTESECYRCVTGLDDQ